MTGVASPRDPDDDARVAADWGQCYLRVEAAGSCKVLIARLAVSVHDSISALKQKVATHHPLGLDGISPTVLQLFAGHGGNELSANDNNPTDSGAATLHECGISSGDVIVVGVCDAALRRERLLASHDFLLNLETWFDATATAPAGVATMSVSVRQLEDAIAHSEAGIVVGFAEAARLGVMTEFRGMFGDVGLSPRSTSLAAQSAMIDTVWVMMSRPSDDSVACVSNMVAGHRRGGGRLTFLPPDIDWAQIRGRVAVNRERLLTKSQARNVLLNWLEEIVVDRDSSSIR